jgi:hypothetical protein
LIRTGIGLVGVIALIGSAVAGALVFLVLISFGGGSLVFMRACGSPISLAVAIVALAVAAGSATPTKITPTDGVRWSDYQQGEPTNRRARDALTPGWRPPDHGTECV